jgi:hypothetical protein
MEQNKFSLFMHLWNRGKPWLGVASLLGAGLLPCPECGAPLLWHFWPIAAVLALRNIVQERKRRHLMPPSAQDLSKNE